jgi:predicted deacetylase
MKSLVVSVHDVSPSTRAVCDRMLDALARLGVVRTSLLVIPNHHHHGHFLDDPAFCRWLASRATAGHEIVIHGYFHQRAAREGEDLRDRFVTQVYTAHEGEFYDLSQAEAADLLGRAKSDFARFRAEYAPGVPTPVGFIAPAWLLGAEAEAAVREAGFGYTTRLTTFDNLRTGEVTRSQSLVYSPRNAWRRVVSRGWNAWLSRRLRGNPLLRIGLHPPDFQFPTLWRQIERIVTSARQERSDQTYAAWLEAGLERG